MCANLKQSVSSYRFEVADDKYSHIARSFVPYFDFKNGKPLKQKYAQIQKQSVNSYRFEVADDKYGYN